MARNTSDSIEEYIKELLGQSGIAEIQRSNLADTFQVVPSQINYVIKTRFTESRGYIVESKRGGGGYIRIVKVRFSDKHHMINDLLQNLADQLSEQVFTDLIQLLFDEKRGEAETLAGFLLEISGNFPQKGKPIVFHNYSFTVEAFDKHRIKEIKVKINS